MTTSTPAADVQARLEQAEHARAEHARITERLTGARGYLESLEGRVAELRQRLDSESADVEKLESFSPTRILAALKGSASTALERETAERDAARYAVAEAEARRDMARRDCEGLEAQIRDLGDVLGDYERALEAKQAWVEVNDVSTASALDDLAAQRGRLLAEDNEAREAYASGQMALQMLGHAQELLGSAQSWSTWDTFGGGGMWSDMAKYQRIDEATAVLREADNALGVFSRELADVSMPPIEGVRIDGMSRTFDVFFDNIFSDMAVRGRIQDAAARTAHAGAAVSQALVAIQVKAQRIREELAALDARREQLLRA